MDERTLLEYLIGEVGRMRFFDIMVLRDYCSILGFSLAWMTRVFRRRLVQAYWKTRMES